MATRMKKICGSSKRTPSTHRGSRRSDQSRASTTHQSPAPGSDKTAPPVTASPIALELTAELQRTPDTLTIYAAHMQNRSLGKAGRWLLNDLTRRLCM